MKKTILDVGCGSCWKGTVNCDLYVGETPHIMNLKRFIAARNIPNFVHCSGEKLPFRDKSFDIVIASHVLEHVVNPATLIYEMKRVSTNIVVVEVPNLRRFFEEENPYHIYSWSALSLTNLLRLFFEDVKIYGCGSYISEDLQQRAGIIGIWMKFFDTLLRKILGPFSLRAICKIKPSPLVK